MTEYHVEAAAPAQPGTIEPRLARVFCRDARRAAATLREALAAGDISLFAIKAHAMKSALANIGEEEFAKSALALEKAGKSGDMEYIAEKADVFIDALEELAGSLGPEDHNSEDAVEDTAFLAEQMQVIIAACQNYRNMIIYAAIDRLEERRWKPDTAEAFARMRETLLMRSDFEDTAELAKTLLASAS